MTVSPSWLIAVGLCSAGLVRAEGRAPRHDIQIPSDSSSDRVADSAKLGGLPLWAQAGADGLAHSAALPHFRCLHQDAARADRDAWAVSQAEPINRSAYDEDTIMAADSQVESQTEEASLPETPKHGNLFPLSVGDVIGWLIAVITIFIAAGGGIGGGGVLVPLYISVWSFQTEHAIALSNLTIAGGALANLFCNVGRRHPVAQRPLIDWDLIVVMEPMTIIGAVFGSNLTKLLPAWLTTLLLFALLLVMGYRLWSRAISMFRQETASLSPVQSIEINDITLAQAEEGEADFEPLLSASWESANKGLVERILACDTQQHLAPPPPHFPAVKELLEAEAKPVPVATVIALVSVFLWLLVTDTSKTEVPCGGVLYWLLVLSIVPVVAGLMTIVRRRLITKGNLKLEVGLVPEVGDIRWTPRTTLTHPAACSFAGVIAGMFGVGGGIIKGPLMLHLGVLPEVAAATSATMILFTAGSASVVYLTFGGVKWDYAILMICTGFFVTIAGQMLTYHVIETMGRRSVIVIAMAVLLSVGAVIICYETISIFVRDFPDHLLDHGSICGDATDGFDML